MFEKKEKQVEAPNEFTPAKLYMWIKGLEGKVNNLIREVDVLKNDIVSKSNAMRKEQKTQAQDLVDMRHAQDQMVQKMDLIIKELKQTAGSEEVTTLKKYVEFWNPMTFVTQRDLDRAIDAKIHTGKQKKEKA